MTKPVHLIGLLGSKLDAGRSETRWSNWRPSVAACQHEDLLIARFDLLFETRQQDLADFVAADIASVSPETDVQLHAISLMDPWDFEEVFSRLHEFARS